MSIVLKSVDFEWPNGHVVFKDLNLSLESGRKYGLVGPNGVGKSTLAKLIQGELAPNRGKAQIKSRVSCCAQFERRPDLLVFEYLSELWMNVTPADTDVIEALQGNLDFESSCQVLSGGEWTRVRLLKLLSTGADFMILDEPSNNLDRPARASVLDFVHRTTRGVLVISHDRELLGAVSSILELSKQGLSIYGGNWNEYESARELERARLSESLDTAERDKERAQEERAKKLDTQTKRMRQAKNAAPKLGLPKILIGARKRKAQRTLGKLKVATDKELDKRVDAVRAAHGHLKVDQTIYAEFPETAIPAGKLVLEVCDLNFQYEGSAHSLWQENLNFVMKGPEKVAIVGNNGSGKTTFLNLLTGTHRLNGAYSGSLKMGDVEYGFIDQQTLILDDGKTVFQNAYETSQRSVIEIRNLLAQFLFPGKNADQVVSTLSGGERLRAALAKVMISDPVPQLLILDEPTNNLDLANLEFLEIALSQFNGALIVVSHDVTFLEKIGIGETLKLG